MTQGLTEWHLDECGLFPDTVSVWWKSDAEEKQTLEGLRGNSEVIRREEIKPL